MYNVAYGSGTLQLKQGFQGLQKARAKSILKEVIKAARAAAETVKAATLETLQAIISDGAAGEITAEILTAINQINNIKKEIKTMKKTTKTTAEKASIKKTETATGCTYATSDGKGSVAIIAECRNITDDETKTAPTVTPASETAETMTADVKADNAIIAAETATVKPVLDVAALRCMKAAEIKRELDRCAEELKDCAEFIAFCETHGGSRYNQVLLYLQGASEVHGFKKWQQYGRKVKKGAKAVYIICAEPKEKYTKYKFVAVFDISTTEPTDEPPKGGKPGTETTETEKGADAPEKPGKNAALAVEAAPVKVEKIPERTAESVTAAVCTYGYKTDKEPFTAEQIKQLAAFTPVLNKKNKYNSFCSYFAVAYSDGIKLIYQVNHYCERDTIDADQTPELAAIMITDNKVFCADALAISASLAEDVNKYLLATITTEEQAATLAGKVDGYKRDNINRCLAQDYTEEANRAFYTKKPPVLRLYYRDYDYKYNWDVLISYLQNPRAAVEAEALRYTTETPEAVYIRYIRHNRMTAAYNAIVSDESNEQHKLLKIAESVAGCKSVRIKLTNGNEVKVEAAAVERIPYCGYISEWHVAASDRKLLNKNERGRAEDIHVNDIAEIRYNGRVLYKA